MSKTIEQQVEYVVGPGTFVKLQYNDAKALELRVKKTLQERDRIAYTRGRSDEAKTCEGCKRDRDKAIRIAREEERKAFGGCTKCYGKGYSTVIDSTTYHADFPGDKTHSIPNNPMRFCSCDRGDQLQTLTTPLEEPTARVHGSSIETLEK